MKQSQTVRFSIRSSTRRPTQCSTRSAFSRVCSRPSTSMCWSMRCVATSHRSTSTPRPTSVPWPTSRLPSRTSTIRPMCSIASSTTATTSLPIATPPCSRVLAMSACRSMCRPCPSVPGLICSWLRSMAACPSTPSPSPASARPIPFARRKTFAALPTRWLPSLPSMRASKFPPMATILPSDRPTVVATSASTRVRPCSPSTSCWATSTWSLASTHRPLSPTSTT